MSTPTSRLRFTLGRASALLIFCSLMLCLATGAVMAGGHGQAKAPEPPPIVERPDGPTTVLVTGANRGIGFEFVKQYAERGHRVIATCRNPDSAEELQAYAADRDNVSVEYLDLQDLAGIDALAERYADGPLDMLINNAALMRGPDKEQSFGSFDWEEFDRFFHTNVRGPLKVTEAFWPQLKASGGTATTLTTGRGRNSIPVPGFSYYKGSKAAIDNFNLDIGRQGRRDGVKVLVLMPGRVATRGEKSTRGFVPIEDSVSGMIEVMESHELKQNGKMFRWDGEPVDGSG
ncbi:MAG: SDR family NAD(P)-dependent oxidoreductase [Gammaproteobacteria bacterium]